MLNIKETTTQLTFMTYDARRIIRMLEKDLSAFLFDQMMIMTWCSNYGLNKVSNVLSLRCESFDLRQAIESINEDFDFLHQGKKKKARAVEDTDKNRYKAPKKIRFDLERVVWTNEIAQRLLLVDRKILNSDYQIPLNQLFHLIGQIKDDQEFLDFTESFYMPCSMWTFMNRLSEYLGNQKRMSSEYEVFKPKMTRVHVSEERKERFEQFVEQFKKASQ